MFTMAKIRNGSTYLAHHLSANDYYSAKETVSGAWVGQSAARLGLSARSIGSADEAFERLRSNQHPLTGRQLTSRTGDGRIAFFDFQCSAPKSVSILAVTFGVERLRTAHHQAVGVAFAELERFAARRVRNGRSAWTEEIETTGNVCAARFEHDASRALDPQLHTHLVTANATFDKQNDRWFALTEREMLSAIRYAGKVYQNELARGVLAAGYEIKMTRNPRGAIEGFEVVGITEDERRQASKRRSQIESGIKSFEAQHGRAPTTREVHAITTSTRDPKLVETTTSEVRLRQRAEYSRERIEQIERLIIQTRQSAAPRPLTEERAALSLACSHVFERESVRQGHELLAEALNQRLGHVEIARLKSELVNSKAYDCMALEMGPGEDLKRPFASREGLQQELVAIRAVNRGIDHDLPLGLPRFVPDSRLSGDQKQAVLKVLKSTDTVCALRGLAGTGKTTALSEIRAGLEQAGRRVIAAAPTTSATDELRVAGFQRAVTLTSLLSALDPGKPPPFSGATVIIDEAGLVSARDGARLLAYASHRDLRIILVGDSRQHSAVEAGDFLSILERHSRLRTAELTDIRRQTQREYRDAVRSLSSGQARVGLEAIDRLGWLHEAKGDYIQVAANHYIRSTAEQRETILVAPTWEEIHRVTDAIRIGLKNKGVLGAGMEVTVAETLDWTKSHASIASHYEPGLVLSLHRTTGGIKAGTTVEVTAVGPSALTVRTQDGSLRSLTPRLQSRSWTVARPRQIELASGDRVMVRQNHRDAGLVNGTVLTLESRLDDGGWQARNDAGAQKVIPADFRALSHGYAVTSYKAQGRTADEVIVCAAQLDARSAYVTFSRGRKRATAYTVEKAALFAGLPSQARPRLAAVDIWERHRTDHLRWIHRIMNRVRQVVSRVIPAPVASPHESPFQQPSAKPSETPPRAAINPKSVSWDVPDTYDSPARRLAPSSGARMKA